jgi:ADP-ribose pyrophosphatase YjhB (NUDIX family)
MFPDRPVVSVGAVIIDAGRVLFVKRGQAPLQGEWSFPGGVVELGEALEAAVAREAREETGLDVEVGPVVEVLTRIERSDDGRVQYHYVIIDYLCGVRGGTATAGSDADDVRWVDRASLHQLRTTPAVTAAAAKALALASRRTLSQDA